VKRFVFIAVCWLLVVPVSAQRFRVWNQPYADMKMFHLGFHLGLHTQDLILSHTGALTEEGERWFAEIPAYSPGFSVGIIGDMFVNPYMNLRVIPSIHFGDKRFRFRAESDSVIYLTSVRSNYLMLPLELKYSALRLNNYRPYLTAGVYGAIDLGRKKGEALLLKSLDYGVSFGLGCDTYFPLFKFCPEIKFFFGLRDLLEKSRSDLKQPDLMVYSDALGRAVSRMIVLTFNFE